MLRDEEAAEERGQRHGSLAVAAGTAGATALSHRQAPHAAIAQGSAARPTLGGFAGASGQACKPQARESSQLEAKPEGLRPVAPR